MTGPFRITLTALLLSAAGGCGSRGEVTFTISPPTNQPLNPIADRSRVSEYSIKRFDGTLIGVASDEPTSSETLSLGVLAQLTTPSDLVMTVLSGSELLGMARLRDVVIEPGKQHDYVAELRKPLITIGSALPDETLAGNLLLPGKIVDPVSGQDLSHPKVADPANPAPQLPMGTTSASATWDGRFILAASGKMLTVIDTGTGATVGAAQLGFSASRVAVGARDTAVAVLDPAGAVLLFPDVPSLTSNPQGATGTRVQLMGMQRTVTFAADGKSLYVLSGGGVDPCSPTAATPTPNGITVLGLDGSMLGAWTFTGFAADIAVDATSGAIAVSQTTDNRVGWLDPTTGFGAAKPTKLLDAVCPNGLRIANGEVFVLTNERNATSTSLPVFYMQRASLAGGAVSKVSFSSPVYDNVDMVGMPTPDGNTRLKFQFTPVSIVAYEMAISPDATRLVLATRARYHEANASLVVLDAPCKATFDIVEYGVYTLDTRTGQALYSTRSQIVGGTGGSLPACITCDAGIGGPIPFPCNSVPGDRAAGVSAVFGGP